MIVDQSGWGAIRVTGSDRARFMQGMCMGNVARVEPGAWLRTASLSPKGRLLSIYDVVRREEDPDALLLLTQQGLAAATRALLERHAIADDVAFEILADLRLHRIWDDPAAVWSAPPVFAPPPAASAAADEVEVRRVEAGLPLFGVDVGEDSFPFETPLAALIDYEKGCYVGQEPVARVRARGTPGRLLRGLAVAGDGPVARGARIDHPARPEAGHVTSSAVSPRFGSIALGFLARAAWEVGGQVTIEGRPATVVGLPFS